MHPGGGYELSHQGPELGGLVMTYMQVVLQNDHCTTEVPMHELNMHNGIAVCDAHMHNTNTALYSMYYGNQPSLVLNKARHLSGSAFCNFSRL